MIICICPHLIVSFREDTYARQSKLKRVLFAIVLTKSYLSEKILTLDKAN